jgi:predicted dehydrogenase
MRFLVLGLGGIGQRHVRNLRTILGDDAEIFAYRVLRNSPTLTDRLAVEDKVNVEEKYGITVVSDFEAGLALKPDAVLICNPSSLHVPMAMAAAEAGCHLFIEKPLSHNEDDVQKLIDLVESRGLVTLVGYQLRFHPVLRRLESLLKEHAIGKVTAVRIEVGEYLPGWHTYEDYRQMYASRADLGGGVILSQIHELDYIYWLFGLPQKLFALGGHLSDLEIDVEDTASILMECVVDGRAVPVHLHQDYLQRPPSRTCEVIGSAGKILLDFNALSVTQYGAEGQLEVHDSFEGFERNELFLDEMKHFLACVRHEETSLVTVREGAQSLRMALAAKESLATGSIQNLGGDPDE